MTQNNVQQGENKNDKKRKKRGTCKKITFQCYTGNNSSPLVFFFIYIALTNDVSFFSCSLSLLSSHESPPPKRNISWICLSTVSRTVGDWFRQPDKLFYEDIEKKRNKVCHFFFFFLLLLWFFFFSEIFVARLYLYPASVSYIPTIFLKGRFSYLIFFSPGQKSMCCHFLWLAASRLAAVTDRGTHFFFSIL